MSPRRMSVREARANFSDLLGSVHYTKEPVIVEKQGRPFAVVISTEDFDRLTQAREEFVAVVDRIRSRNADLDPAEILRDVTVEVEAVRQEMHEKRQSATEGDR